MEKNKELSRRRFMQFGSAVIAGGTASAASVISAPENESKKTQKKHIQTYRKLGRTGFQASDISIGCSWVNDGNIIRYAYDSGINYFDTAEAYGSGESERSIGDALKHMDRKKIFITTKLGISDKDTKETILDRFTKSQERINSHYTDGLYMHAVSRIADLQNKAFHAATDELKADGRLKHIGISCHGPGWQQGDSMEDICIAAAEDGRFDLMLFVYSFMNKDAGNNILAACKKKNVGTTAMKTAPGVFSKPEVFDSENLSEEQEKQVQDMVQRGMSRNEALGRLKQWNQDSLENYENSKTFIEKHSITSQEQLKKFSIQWVLANPDMQTICVSISEFEALDTYIPLSGTQLSRTGAHFLNEYARMYSNQYCRHGCKECLSSCPSQVPVSTIMRYANYFSNGWEKGAMSKYHALGTQKANLCLTCSAPCENACPHGLKVQANLIRADSILSLV